MNFNHFVKYINAILNNVDVQSRFKSLLDESFKNEILSQLNSLTNQFYYKVDFNYAQYPSDVSATSSSLSIKSKAKVHASLHKGNLFNYPMKIFKLDNNYLLLVSHTYNLFIYDISSDIWTPVKSLFNYTTPVDDNDPNYDAIHDASFVKYISDPDHPDNYICYLFIVLRDRHVIKVYSCSSSDIFSWAYLGSLGYLNTTSPTGGYYDDTNPNDKDYLHYPYYIASRQNGDSIDLFFFQNRGYALSDPSVRYSLVHYSYSPSTNSFTYKDVILDAKTSRHFFTRGLYPHPDNMISVYDNRIFVSSYGYNEIGIFEADPPYNLLLSLNSADFSFGNSFPSLTRPSVIFYDDIANKYYIFFKYQDTIGIFDNKFNFLKQFGTGLSSSIYDIPLALNNVKQITDLDGSDSIYVVDQGNRVIYSLIKDYDQLIDIDLYLIPPYPLPSAVYIENIADTQENIIATYYVSQMDASGNPIKWLELKDNLPYYLPKGTQARFKVSIKFNYQQFQSDVGFLKDLYAFYRIEE